MYTYVHVYLYIHIDAYIHMYTYINKAIQGGLFYIIT